MWEETARITALLPSVKKKWSRQEVLSVKVVRREELFFVCFTLFLGIIGRFLVLTREKMVRNVFFEAMKSDLGVFINFLVNTVAWSV
jgi:hypothetical protein